MAVLSRAMAAAALQRAMAPAALPRAMAAAVWSRSNGSDGVALGNQRIIMGNEYEALLERVKPIWSVYP